MFLNLETLFSRLHRIEMSPILASPITEYMNYFKGAISGSLFLRHQIVLRIYLSNRKLKGSIKFNEKYNRERNNKSM